MGGTFRVGLFAALTTLACASDPLALAGKRYTHATLGASFVDPSSFGAGWRLVELEAASAAFAGPGGAAISWLRECRAVAREPRWLARTLLLGVEGARLTREFAREVDAAPGWELFARVEGGRTPLALHAVIRAGEPCSDDWVLVAPGDTAPHEAVFERWRASFAGEAGGG